MEIHQLSYVLAISKYSSFSVAAEHENISQPTLSQQIKKLEKELGVDLFIRNTHSVRLTNAGEEFIAYANRILSEMNKAQNAMLEFTHLNKGIINIGVLPIISFLGLTHMIADFHNIYPALL
jgi:LysR family hydrogen peroxide-inducible transcriptional activator